MTWRSGAPLLLRSLSLLPLLLLTVASLAAQTTAPEPSDPPRSEDPFEAYDAGRFEAAAEGFESAPLSPESRALNVGAARYRLDDFEGAAAAFERALASEDDGVRAEALYNLGNTAFRRGEVEEAVGRYRSALELAPEDEDVKFNLELARRVLEQQQQQQQQQQQNPEEESEDRQDQQDQQGEPPQDDGEQEQSGQDGEDQDSQPPGQEGADRADDGSPAGEGQPGDRDGDGLPDEVERGGENPTDPANPDTDGDGRRDGEEDANGNGRVDPGETDPNRRDSPNGESTGASEPSEMSAAEAQRYLDSLSDQRPDAATRHRGRVRRGEKDW